jgi:hypothetical protein
MLAMNVRSAALLVAASLPAWPKTAGAQTIAACIAAADEGQDQLRHGKLRDARRSFVVCSQERCPVVVRKDCDHWLEQVNLDMPTVVFGAKDASGQDLATFAVRVDTDAEETATPGIPRELDPGPHTFAFERPGAPPITQSVVLRTGERNRQVLVTFPAVDVLRPPPVEPPAPPAHSVSPWVYGFAGLAALATGSFVYFAVSGLHEKSDLRSTCAPACTDSQVSKLRTDYIVADVSLGIGVVSLAVVGTIWLLGPSKKSPAPVGFQVSPHGVGLHF